MKQMETSWHQMWEIHVIRHKPTECPLWMQTTNIPHQYLLTTLGTMAHCPPISLHLHVTLTGKQLLMTTPWHHSTTKKPFAVSLSYFHTTLCLGIIILNLHLSTQRLFRFCAANRTYKFNSMVHHEENKSLFQLQPPKPFLIDWLFLFHSLFFFQTQ